MGSVVLTLLPPEVASTSIEKVHVALAGIWPPVRLMLFTMGVIVPVVPVGSQFPRTGSGTRLSGLAMINPAGRLSLTDTFVKSVAGLGLVIVKVSVTLPFNGTVAAENAFAIVGGDCAPAVLSAKNRISPGATSRRAEQQRNTANIKCATSLMRQGLASVNFGGYHK